MYNTIEFYNLKWSDSNDDITECAMYKDDLIKHFNIDISKVITEVELKKLTDFYFVGKDLPTLLSYDYKLM